MTKIKSFTEKVKSQHAQHTHTDFDIIQINFTTLETRLTEYISIIQFINFY